MLQTKDYRTEAYFITSELLLLREVDVFQAFIPFKISSEDVARNCLNFSKLLDL